jgi:hypothetical protein
VLIACTRKALVLKKASSDVMCAFPSETVVASAFIKYVVVVQVCRSLSERCFLNLITAFRIVSTS